tara:strand:- start:46 stop:363 length:318 start_codon:yes stop_codon:yes gene_type:complete
MTITKKTELDFKEATLKYRCKKTGKIEIRTANLQEWFEDEMFDLIGFETEEMSNLKYKLEHLICGLFDADRELNKTINALKPNLEYQRKIIRDNLLDIDTKSKSL